MGIAYVKTPGQHLEQKDESGCVRLVLNLHAKKHVNVQVKVELEVQVRRVQTTEYTSMVLKYIVMEGKLVNIINGIVIRILAGNPQAGAKGMN